MVHGSLVKMLKLFHLIQKLNKFLFWKSTITSSIFEICSLFWTFIIINFVDKWHYTHSRSMIITNCRLPLSLGRFSFLNISSMLSCFSTGLQVDFPLFVWNLQCKLWLTTCTCDSLLTSYPINSCHWFPTSHYCSASISKTPKSWAF